MDEPNYPRESDDNALVDRTKARVLGRGIADGCIPNKFVVVESNPALGATSTMPNQIQLALIACLGVSGS